MSAFAAQCCLGHLFSLLVEQGECSLLLLLLHFAHLEWFVCPGQAQHLKDTR